MPQQVLDVSNEVAAELAGVEDGVLEALRERLGCSISLRGNRLTLDGDEQHVEAAHAVVDELVELVEGGHQIGPDTVGSVLAALDQAEDVRDIFEDVVWRHRGKKIAPKTVNQKRYVDAIRERTVTFAIGPAGTGKTYLAMALAVAALSEGVVGRIILTRPAVEAGERLGFLPGDMLAKVDPYLRPLYDALYDMIEAERLAGYMERGTIEVAPLAFMRGRTLNDSFIVLDEAQNTSPEQMQMFLTRLGFGSKMVVTGDVTQIDLPREQASGLIQVREILSDLEGISFVEFGHEDVVRHKLVQRIVEAYKRHAEETGTARTAVIVVETENRSDAEVAEAEAADLARTVLAAEGFGEGELGIVFVGAAEMRTLKREHLGIDEATDVLSFPLDGRELCRKGVPRALGDVVLCPEVVGDEWHARSSTASCTCSATSTEPRWRPASRRTRAMSANRRSPSIFNSFNNAAEGVIHALRTQRNLWIHFTSRRRCS